VTGAPRDVRCGRWTWSEPRCAAPWARSDSGWWPIKRFETVAEGKRLPGAGFFVAGGAVGGTVATAAIISSGVGVVREVFASVDADSRRTAEQIAAQVAQMKASQRW